MTIRSLGYRTDLLTLGSHAEIENRGEYTVIRTPSNRSHYWGNFLLFNGPPEPGDLERWTALFAREIGEAPDVRHVALGWESPRGDLGEIQPFLDADFKLEDSIVLAAESVRRPAKYCDEAEVRPLREEGEWQAAIEIHVACREDGHEEKAYREFATRSLARYRAMVAAGRGEWFGAFLDGTLAGDLGLFVFDGLGRFQTVGTHPDFRRRGVCSALVHQSAAFARSEMGATTLVMVADAYYHAARIYERVGFRPQERQIGLTWWAR